MFWCLPAPFQQHNRYSVVKRDWLLPRSSMIFPLFTNAPRPSGTTKKPFPLTGKKKGEKRLFRHACNAVLVDNCISICYILHEVPAFPAVFGHQYPSALQQNTDYVVIRRRAGVFLFLRRVIGSDAYAPCGGGAPYPWRRYRSGSCRCWRDRECPRVWQGPFRSRKRRGRTGAADCAERPFAG